MPMAPNGCSLKVWDKKFNFQKEFTWNDVPTAFMKLVANRWKPMWGYDQDLKPIVKVAYHKADVQYVGGDVLISKSCQSYRPEGQLWLGNEKVAYAYFGMGTQESHPLDNSFVLFGKKISVLLAAIAVLEDNGHEVDKRLPLASITWHG